MTTPTFTTATPAPVLPNAPADLDAVAFALSAPSAALGAYDAGTGTVLRASAGFRGAVRYLASLAVRPETQLAKLGELIGPEPDTTRFVAIARTVRAALQRAGDLPTIKAAAAGKTASGVADNNAVNEALAFVVAIWRAKGDAASVAAFLATTPAKTARAVGQCLVGSSKTHAPIATWGELDDVRAAARETEAAATRKPRQTAQGADSAPADTGPSGAYVAAAGVLADVAETLPEAVRALAELIAVAKVAASVRGPAQGALSVLQRLAADAERAVKALPDA